MEKKASAGTYIAVISIIGIIIGAIFIIYLASKGIPGINKPTEVENTIPFFLLVRDEITKEPIASNYRLGHVDNRSLIIYSEGEITNSWTELTAPLNQRITVSAWSDKYYLTNAIPSHDAIEIENNKSTLVIDLRKIGDISLKHTGDLNSRLKIIKFNITSKNYFAKPNICFAWTSGFKYVSLKNNYINCDNGIWRNWSEYNATTNEYKLLPEGMFQCGEKIEICNYVSGKNCKINQSYRIPPRYKGLVDNCEYVGKSINNETYEIEIEVHSEEEKGYLDEIRIIVFDKDRRYNAELGLDTWYSEIGGKNIGNPNDFEYVLDFQGNKVEREKLLG